MTIKVGLDYDEPIFDWYDYAHEASVAAGLADPSAPPPTVWDPSTHYGCTLDEWIDVLNREVLKGMDGMYGRPLLPERVEQVKRLYRAGYDVYIITARGQFGNYGEAIKALTRTQIMHAGLPNDGIYFTTHKGGVARDLGLHYFLDDGPKHYDDVSRHAPQTFLLNKPWNLDHPVPEHRRVDSLEQFVDLVLAENGNLFPMSAKQRAHVHGAAPVGK